MADDVTQSSPPVAAAPAPSPPARGIRPSATAWIALGIAAVVVVATLVVLLAGNQGQASYPADSPEAALQGYLTSWYDDDYDTSYTFFSASVHAQMSESDFRQEAEYGYGPENQSVSLERVSGSGDSRTLHLTVEEFYGPDYGGGGYPRDMQVRMVLESGAWKIDDALIGLEPYYGSFDF